MFSDWCSFWGCSDAPHVVAQGDPVKLRAFFEAFNAAFQNWAPAEDAGSHPAVPEDALQAGGRSQSTITGSIDGEASRPAVVVVRGCAFGHPRDVMEALVNALGAIPTEFSQGDFRAASAGRAV